MRILFLAVMIMFQLQVAAKAEAASVAVVPGTNGVYYIKGYDFTDISGVEIEIQYDTATLSNPRITQGPLLASTMFIPNNKFSASSVKIGAMSLSPIKGSSDLLATITFDVKGSSPGPVTIAREKLVDTKATAVKQENPLAPVVDDKRLADERRLAEERRLAAERKLAEERAAVDQSAYGGSTSVSGGYATGTITLPPDSMEAAEADRNSDYQPLVTDLRKDMTLPLGGSSGEKVSDSEKKPEAAKKDQPQKFISYKSALQLFTEFKGVRSAENLIPVFAEISMPDFIQEPLIAFSDGKTPLKIVLTLKQSGSDLPKFILQGANVKLISSKGEDTVTWTIEAIPKKDAVEATLTVIEGQTVMDFPLTVVPEINALLTKGKALSEADLAAYLEKPSKFDLNKDGKFDAVDDYIYVANYIVAMKIAPEKAKKEETKAVAKPEVKDADKTKKPTSLKDEKRSSAEKTPLKP